MATIPLRLPSFDFGIVSSRGSNDDTERIKFGIDGDVCSGSMVSVSVAFAVTEARALDLIEVAVVVPSKCSVLALRPKLNRLNSLMRRFACSVAALIVVAFGLAGLLGGMSLGLPVTAVSTIVFVAFFLLLSSMVLLGLWRCSFSESVSTAVAVSRLCSFRNWKRKLRIRSSLFFRLASRRRSRFNRRSSSSANASCH